MIKNKPKPALVLLKNYNDPKVKDLKTEHSLKIRINYLRKREYYNTGLQFTEGDWNNHINVIKPPKRFQEFKDKCDKILTKAKGILEEMEKESIEFTFPRFEAIWYQLKPKGIELFNLMEEKYLSMKEDSPKAAAVYKNANTSLWEFNGKNKVKFSNVTVDFLRKYEKWMLNGCNDEKPEPRSKATIGIYLRALRHIFKTAIDKGYLKKESYPFGTAKDKYQIPVGKASKRAVKPEEIAVLFNFKCRNDKEAFRRDMFKMALLSNGANGKDVYSFKFKNMDDEKITFERAKTINTLNEPLIGTIMLTDEIRAIIKRWANKDRSPENYIFPVLNDRSFVRWVWEEKGGRKVKQKVAEKAPTPPEYMQSRITELVDNFNKQVTKTVRGIFKHLKMKVDIRAGDARDSFATIMRDAGVSTEFIQEALLHANITTTKDYLSQFPDAVKKQHAKLLSKVIEESSKKTA